MKKIQWKLELNKLPRGNTGKQGDGLLKCDWETKKIINLVYGVLGDKLMRMK